MNTAIQESDKLREVKYEQKQEKKYLDLIEESKETQSHQNSQLEWIKQGGFCNNSELEKEE